MISFLKKQILKQQFNPGFIGIFLNPFYIARKGLQQNLAELGKNITGKTLDVGCGTKPYQHLFKSDEYIGLEYDTGIDNDKKKADYYYDGKIFPFDDGEFDSVVTNQVLEHIFSPDEFLSEINRVLKTDGKLLLTVPFVWDEHEQPYDYARYSSFGLKSLLNKNGFEIIESRKSVNDFRVIAQLFNAYVYKITRKNIVLKNLSLILIIAPVTIIGILVSIILPRNNDLYLDNIVLAKKK
ncbi:MAG TPA: class I SAM-dependent methyltransferase [Ignavibacteriaceae bacterium]|nr:class I SAM-dependent methyltransferase [Ignavibacteriaceae bacterium]